MSVIGIREAIHDPEVDANAGFETICEPRSRGFPRGCLDASLDRRHLSVSSSFKGIGRVHELLFNFSIVTREYTIVQ